MFIATHVPLPEDASPLPYADKVSHVIIYLILTFLLALWWQTRYQPVKRHQLLIIGAIMIIYSIFDELSQGLVGRTPQIWDGVADLVGTFLGLAFFVGRARLQSS